MSQGTGGTNLVRTMGLREATTTSTGLVVGVGIFTVGSAAVGALNGGSIILATFFALVVSIYPCLMYGEMGAALPYAGGTYNFARRALGKGAASIAAWHYIVTITTCAAGEGLAFANYFSWMFKAFGVDFRVDTRILAFILMLFFSVINYFGIEVSSKIQNGFVFFFWGATLVWMIYMFRNGDAANFLWPGAETMPGLVKFVEYVVVVWWCFSGFETSLGLAGEVKFPQINIPRSMILIPFVLFAINGLMQWFLTALVPLDMQSMLLDAAAPYAEGLTAAGYVGFPIFLLCLAVAFGGDMSTMNPCVSAPSRYFYAMSRDGVMPKALSKLHPKYKTPYVAIIVTAAIVFLLILTNSIAFIAILSASSMFWVYIIGYISFWRLRKKEPELKRPFKVKGAAFGVVFSIIIYIIMFIACGLYNDILSCSITAACLIYYFLWGRKHMKSDEETRREVDEANIALELEVPTAEEKAKLDREFHIWLGAAIGFCILVCVLFIVYWMM